MILNFQAVKFLSSRTEDSPTHRSITLSNIEEVKPYRKKEYYFLRIRTLKQEDIDLKFLNKDICKESQEKDNKIYALKQMNKDELLYKNQMKYAMTELSILKNCIECPFIIDLGYAFQTEDYLYLAMKYHPFGNLK